MATLTQDTDRERYFAWRSGALQVALTVSFVAAGHHLHQAGSDRPKLLMTYVMLFALGAVVRGLSALTLAKQARVRPLPATNAAPLRGLLDALHHARWSTALYLAVLMFGAQVAVPFFTPYMLRELQLDYATYSGLTAISIVIKVAVFPACHRIAQRIGLRALLVSSGIGVAVVPALWTVLTTPAEIAMVQAISGIAWAALEYASFQLLLSSAQEEHRLEFLSLASAFSGGLQVLGAVCGSSLLERADLPYHHVFLISSGLRAAALAWLFVSLPKLAWPTQLPPLVTRLWSVRPNAGVVLRVLFRRDERPSEPPQAPPS